MNIREGRNVKSINLKWKVNSIKKRDHLEI